MLNAGFEDSSLVTQSMTKAKEVDNMRGNGGGYQPQRRFLSLFSYHYMGTEMDPKDISVLLCTQALFTCWPQSNSRFTTAGGRGGGNQLPIVQTNCKEHCLSEYRTGEIELCKSRALLACLMSDHIEGTQGTLQSKSQLHRSELSQQQHTLLLSSAFWRGERVWV